MQTTDAAAAVAVVAAPVAAAVPEVTPEDMLKKVQEQIARREKFKMRKEALAAEETAKTTTVESGESAGEAVPMETETGASAAAAAATAAAAAPPNPDAQDDTSTWAGDNEDENAALRKEVRGLPLCPPPPPSPSLQYKTYEAAVAAPVLHAPLARSHPFVRRGILQAKRRREANLKALTDAPPAASADAAAPPDTAAAPPATASEAPPENKGKKQAEEEEKEEEEEIDPLDVFMSGVNSQVAKIKKQDKLRLKNNDLEPTRKRGEVLGGADDAIYSDESDDESRSAWADKRASEENEGAGYGNIFIILNHFSRPFQLYATPHAPLTFSTKCSC